MPETRLDLDMEHGRRLIRNGRAWLPLTDDDIERGAVAVIRDPYYRAEIGRCAVIHAHEIGDNVLAAAICESWDRLNERDGGSDGFVL